MNKFIDTLTSIAVQGDVYRALAMAREYEEREPLRYHLGASAVYAAAKRVELCMAHAREAYQLAPEEPAVLQQYAIAHVLAESADLAEQYARLALMRDGSVRSRRWLANIFLRIGKLDEAERLYSEILASDPNNVEARNGLGLLHWQMGDNAAALECFADAYAAAPDDPSALRHLVDMYVEAGWAIGAVALARITQSEHHREAVNVALDMMNLAIMRQIAPDFAGRELVVETPQTISGLVGNSLGLSSAVQLHIARMLLESNHIDAAQAIVERLRNQIESLSVEDRATWHHVAGLLAEQAGKEDDALAHYTAAVDKDHQRWDACSNAVTTLLQRGDEKSLAEVERLLGLVPNELKLFRHELLYKEAVFLQRVGRNQEAGQHCRTIIEMGGKHGPMADVARRTLRELEEAEKATK